MKNLLITLAKYAVSIGIVYWLITSVKNDNPKVFTNLRDQPKDWTMLVAGTALCLGAVMLTIYRWYLLVRALELPFRVRDAFRLGFLGFLLNFISVGSVGGDLFKAVFIAREQPGRRAQAVATVVVDRLIGLYALFIVASGGILVSGILFNTVVDGRIVKASWATLAITLGGAVAVGILAIPGFSQGRIANRLERIPKIGGTIQSLIEAAGMYRQRPAVLAVAMFMSIIVHAMFTVCIYLIATGLPGAHPTFLQHFIVVPMSVVTGTLPLPGGGLGALEFVMNFYYQNIGGPGNIPSGQGLMVALGYRVATIVVAIIGLCYYLVSRKDVTNLIHEAEHELESPEPLTDSRVQYPRVSVDEAATHLN